MDFPSNSHKIPVGEQPPKKEITKVVSGEVISKKKPLGQRMKNILFAGELKSASQYIVREVLVPSFKNLIVDATSKGVERVIYGQVDPRKRSMMNYGPTRFSYNAISRDRSPRMLPDQPPRFTDSRRMETQDIVLSSREDAELVIDRLKDIVDQYEVASVADLNELLGSPSAHTDHKWGWTSLGFSGIRQIREGYLLDLPPAQPI